MSNETKQDLFNRRETLTEVFESLFSAKSGGAWAFLKIIVGIMSIGWLADSFLPFIHGWALIWWDSPNAKDLNFTDAGYQLSFALAWFLSYLTVLYLTRYSKIRAGRYVAAASIPHRGLLVSLSSYADFSKKLSLADLEKAIDESNLILDDFFNSTNWGQLAFTVAFHSPLLQKCWIFTTPDSAGQFAAAARLVNYISRAFEGREIICTEVKIENENDLSETAGEVSRIYRSLQTIESNLKAADVISNYTGGTAAMSGGMIMATLNENRKIEYLNQKYRGRLLAALLKHNDQSLVLVSSQTNLVIAERLN